MLTVVICTHNPREEILERTISHLKLQTLPFDSWEFLIIDNASSEPLASSWSDWHPNGSIIRENRLGLTQARMRAANEASSEIIVFCDDDNVLEKKFLEVAHSVMTRKSKLGVVGGKSIPEYEITPQKWFEETLVPLGCRDLGEVSLRADWRPPNIKQYPACSPIGAGMVIRKEILTVWSSEIQRDPRRQRLGRTGQSLNSGEDNDLVMTALHNGWDVGYEPELKLIHLIPASRITVEYLAKITEISSRDWVRVLHLHQACPWKGISKWSAPFRKCRSWFVRRAWSSPSAYIRWRGDCGHYTGRVEIK